MDKSPASNFKDIFEKRNRNTASIYSKTDSPACTDSLPIPNRIRTTEDVMMNVSESMLLLQKADRVLNRDSKRKRTGQTQCGIVPFSTFICSTTDKNHYAIPKFETQIGVTDTQLIAITDGVEAMAHIMQNKHGTQCFGATLPAKNRTFDKLGINEENTKPSTSFACVNFQKEGNENITVLSHNQDTKDDMGKYKNIFNQVDDRIQESIPENEDAVPATQENGFKSDTRINNKRPSSPILKGSNLNYKKVRRKDSNSPLKVSKAYCLEEFERFEQRLHSSGQLNVINSQILGEELHFVVGQTTDEQFFKIPSGFKGKEPSQYYKPESCPKIKSRISQDMPTVSDVFILSQSCEINENEKYNVDLGPANDVNSIVDSNDGKHFSTTLRRHNLENSKEKCVGYHIVSNETKNVSVNKSISSLEDIDNMDLDIPQSEFQHNFVSNDDTHEVLLNNLEINRKKRSKVFDKSQKSSKVLKSNDLHSNMTGAVSENSPSQAGIALTILDGMDIDDFSDSLKAVVKLNNLDHSQQFINEITEKANKYPGFSTASNKKIQISENAFKRSETIFNDLDNLELNYIHTKNLPIQDFSTASNTIIEVSEKTHVNTNKILPSVSSNNKLPLPGFSTASNKVILVSEQALKKTKQLFSDVYEESEITNQEVPFNGFATASNKPVKVSENALFQTKNIFDDLDKVETHVHSKTRVPFQGFSTASNKIIPVSEIALQKTKTLFDDLDCNEIARQDESFKGFATASNKPLLVSEKALLRTKNIFDDLDTIELNVNPKGQVPFCRLSTASNKIITVSGKALQKAEQVATNKIVNQEVSSKCLATPSNQTKQVTEQALESTEAIFNEPFDKTFNETNDIMDLKVPLKGFATASNKPVKVSEKALLKTKHIFHDLDNVETNVKGEMKVSFQGFSTASNKPVLVSEKSMLKTKNIFDDLEKFETNLNQKGRIPFQGFSTASNKTIRVSEQALEKTKNIFNDLDREITCEIANQEGSSIDFTTAINEPVLVTEEAILKTKRIFDNLEKVDTNVNVKGRMPFQGFSTASNKFIHTSPLPCYPSVSSNIKLPLPGFSTASNKVVHISELAFEKTKQIFSDLDQDQTIDIANQEMSLIAFATASEKPIQVSKDSLLKTKNYFDGLDDIDMNVKTQEIKQFQGFSTASNKTVRVSEEALAKTKNIFNDLDQDDKVENADGEKALKNFTTASNEPVEISERASLESKTVFNGILVEKELKEIVNMDLLFAVFSSDETALVSEQVISGKDRVIQNIGNDKENLSLRLQNRNSNESKMYINEKLDTQLIGHFENINFTSNTQKDVVIQCSEENANTTIAEKPCSPILSCPTARKRKSKTSFRIPHSKSRKLFPRSPTELPINVDFEKNLDKCIDHDMKIAIRDYDSRDGSGKFRISLKELKYIDGNENCNSIIESEMPNFENLNEFLFKNERIDIPEYCENEISASKLETVFLNSVEQNLVPDGWFRNHFKLIAWKLISYETFFPNSMRNVFSVKNVLEQLKYRYQKELYRTERSCLRKVLEMDEVPSRNMVLVVVRIHVVKDENGSDGIELDLTDGWYLVRSSRLDSLLSTAARSGKIRVGIKLLVHGAELLNCDQGKSPLEDIGEVRLRISGNSTRRVTWDTKLGFFRRPEPVLVRLRSVSAGGGKISRLRVFIARLYPRIYVEKLLDGNTITRSERLEIVFACKHESDRQARLEKVYEEVERELELTQSSQSEVGSSETGTQRASVMETGSQIHKMMMVTDDVDAFQKKLTDTQKELVIVYNDRKRQKIQEEIEKRIRSKLEVQGLDQIVRKVVPLLKMKVVSWDRNSGPEPEVKTAFVSIWKPDEGLNDVLKEGVWIDIVNAIPTAERLSEVQLSANRHTTFMESKIMNTSRSDEFEKAVLRKHTPLAELSKTTNQKMFFNEIDTCGLVFHIEPPLMATKDNFQTVFLTDGEFNMASVIFWKGIQKFGFESVVEVGRFVCANNLQKRMGSNRKGIPQFRVTEFSTFTGIPKLKHQVDGLQNLKSSFNEVDLQNLIKFCKNCLDVKFNLEASMQLASITPCRNKSNFNLIKNTTINFKNNNIEYNYNIYGADFESTFVSESDKSYSKNKSKLDKLTLYGDPPPLSAIQLINKSNDVLKQFQSPVRNDISEENFDRCRIINVASNENKICDVENFNIIDKEKNSTISKCDNINMIKSDYNEELGTPIPNVAVTTSFKDLGATSSEKLIIKDRPGCSSFVGTSLEVRKLFLNPITIDFDRAESESRLDDEAKPSLRSGFEEDLDFSPPMSLE